MLWYKPLRDKFDFAQLRSRLSAIRFSQFREIFRALSNRQIQNIPVKTHCPIRADAPVHDGVLGNYTCLTDVTGFAKRIEALFGLGLFRLLQAPSTRLFRVAWPVFNAI
jgi:hypothetical protein